MSNVWIAIFMFEQVHKEGFLVVSILVRLWKFKIKAVCFTICISFFICCLCISSELMTLFVTVQAPKPGFVSLEILSDVVAGMLLIFYSPPRAWVIFLQTGSSLINKWLIVVFRGYFAFSCQKTLCGCCWWSCLGWRFRSRNGKLCYLF